MDSTALHGARRSDYAFFRSILFLRTARVTIDAGKIRVRRVDMHEIMTLRINLINCVRPALRKDEVTRSTITRFDRHLAVGRDVFSVVTTKTAVPILVTDKIRMRSPVSLHLREKVLAINRLRLFDDALGLRGFGIILVQ